MARRPLHCCRDTIARCDYIFILSEGFSFCPRDFHSVRGIFILSEGFSFCPRDFHFVRGIFILSEGHRASQEERL